MQAEMEERIKRLGEDYASEIGKRPGGALTLPLLQAVM
jgi:hypothetical protein